MIQVCRWGPKNLISIGAGGGGAAIQPIWSIRGRRATEPLGSAGGRSWNETDVQRHTGHLPSSAVVFQSARYRIHCGVPFPFVTFSSEIEDLPVVQYTAPHPH